jgi:hypothetical protein
MASSEKRDAARMEKLADGVHVDAVACEKMRAGQRDEARARAECALDEFRRDGTRSGGFEIAHDDAAALEFQPRIHIRRVIAVVAQHLVAFAPRQPIGEKREPERSRPEQRNLFAAPPMNSAQSRRVCLMSRSTSPNSCGFSADCRV